MTSPPSGAGPTDFLGPAPPLPVKVGPPLPPAAADGFAYGQPAAGFVPRLNTMVNDH